MVKIGETLTGVQDALNVRRVFGDPYERDGVTIIPVATFGGGGGGGGDTQGNGGSGFGLGGRPVGAYVIKDGIVSFVPAWDFNRVLVVSLLGLIVLRGMLPWRSRRRRRRK